MVSKQLSGEKKQNHLEMHLIPVRLYPHMHEQAVVVVVVVLPKIEMYNLWE